MRRILVLLPAMLVLAACPRDKKVTTARVQEDTMPLNLDSLQTAIPPAEPDSFKPAKAEPVRARPTIPPAPPALVEVVQREQSFTRFCYQEFGQKVDPSLKGGVAMVVTVANDAITAARVADDTWSSRAGKAVNSCLEDKAPTAWKPATGSVAAGKYVVQLSFRPS